MECAHTHTQDTLGVQYTYRIHCATHTSISVVWVIVIFAPMRGTTRMYETRIDCRCKVHAWRKRGAQKRAFPALIAAGAPAHLQQTTATHSVDPTNLHYMPPGLHVVHFLVHTTFFSIIEFGGRQAGSFNRCFLKAVTTACFLC